VTSSAYALGTLALNPMLSARISGAVSAEAVASVTGLAEPAIFGLLFSLAMHEVAHFGVACSGGFRIGAPTLLPSLSFGTVGAVTRIKTPVPDRSR